MSFVSRIAETLTAPPDNRLDEWPARHISDGGVARPFHRGQALAYDNPLRITAMLAGTQGGKTGFGPWWLVKEIIGRGGGDHLAVTATYDLFKLKMLPALLEVFQDILQIGRFWAGDRILEIADPTSGRFYARRATDKMWGRIILRSADSLGGLESATARSAWLDEAGLPGFTLGAYRAIRRRLALAQGRLLITSTLYDIGWLDTEVLDRAEKGGEKIIERQGDAELEHTVNPAASIALIQFDSIINPQYPIEEYREMESKLPAEDFEMQYRGRRARMRTRIYDTFTRQRDTCPRFPIPEHWERYLGLDFGGVHTAGMYYAEEPESGRLYCYRSYLEGGRTAKAHAEAMVSGEPGQPHTRGGAKGEGQWRDEFASGGLSVRLPRVADVALGINIVYAEIKNHRIIYFDDLEEAIAQHERYRRKRAKDGTLTDEIENKASFHFLDAERYIIASIRGESGQADARDYGDLGSVEGYRSPWA